MTWLGWALNDPAPVEHAGYPFTERTCSPEQRRGVVVHSAEGWFGAKPSDTMRARGNSWSVTIKQMGQVYRHRQSPLWIDWASGGPAQNIGTMAIEMEGKGAQQPWTWEQKNSLLLVLTETYQWFGWTHASLGHLTDKTQTEVLKALNTTPLGSLWEHNWVSTTTCPNGRNDWAWLVPALNDALQEDEHLSMTPEEHLAAHREWEKGDIAAARAVKVGEYVQSDAWDDGAIWIVESTPLGIPALKHVTASQWAALNPKPPVKTISPLTQALLRGIA